MSSCDAPAPSTVTSTSRRWPAGTGQRGVQDGDVVGGGERPGGADPSITANDSPVLEHHAVSGWCP